MLTMVMFGVASVRQPSGRGDPAPEIVLPPGRENPLRTMKILRLTDSSDLYPEVAPELRVPAIAEQFIASAIGEPVGTIQKADCVRRWAGRRFV